MASDNLSGVSVILPAYNEGAAINATVASLIQTLSQVNRPTEIIVVDDGSTDNTAEQARSAGARVIQHPANSGYGRSLLTGIASSKYDAVAIVDADGTYPIDRLPDLLALLDKGFDMVVGARQGEHYYSSFGKRVLRLIFRLLAEYTCGRSIPDINSGFRVFDKRPVLAWKASVSTGFSFTTTITLLFMLNNLLVAYTPVTYNKRIGKSKVRLVSDGLRSLQIIFTSIAQFNPLKLYLLVMIANVIGNLVVIGLLLNSLGPWLLVSFAGLIGWNALCLIMALAILSVAAVKPPARVEK
jgi:polyisoprenyl-phosphate glycosyltransferase